MVFFIFNILDDFVWIKIFRMYLSLRVLFMLLVVRFWFRFFVGESGYNRF